jgi:hypothetical protein
MPKLLPHLFVLGLMIIPIPFSTVQEKPAVIRLKVFHDGQEAAAPSRITLSFDKQALKVPVENGRFAVPSQVLTAPEVGISTDMGQSHIATVIPKQSFVDVFSWEISIADKHYGKDVDYAVPKGANITKSCIVVFIPAHLADRVLPEVPIRQWVLSLPFALRYRLAYDSGLARDVLQIFIRTAFSSLRRRAKKQFGIRKARCGGVTFVQRFGGALKLML